jgi:hypothetical protein
VKLAVGLGVAGGVIVGLLVSQVIGHWWAHKNGRGADVAARWKSLAGGVAARREVVRLLVTPLKLMPAVQNGIRIPADERVKFPEKAEGLSYARKDS